MSKPKAGQKGVCGMCGNPVVYVGPYWKHEGLEYRHPANPKEYPLFTRTPGDPKQ